MKNSFLSSLSDMDQITIIRKEGKKIASKYFCIYIKPNNNNNCLFLIQVFKKLFKLAVDRNKIKRQIRMLLLKNKLIFKGFDIIIQASQKYPKNDFKMIEIDFNNIIKKI